MSDIYCWPAAGPTDIRDGLTTADVIDARYAPALLRMDNRVPVNGADLHGGLRAHQAAAAERGGLRTVGTGRGLDDRGRPECLA